MHCRALIFETPFVKSISTKNLTCVCLHCHSMFQRQLKMALKIRNVFINEDDLILVIVKASTEIDTYVKRYHVYKNIWKPTVNEELGTEMEPDNVMDKYAVCVKKNTSMVVHLPLVKNGKFAKMIFNSSEQTKMPNVKLS